MTPRAKRITCYDRPGPSGSYAVIGDKLYPLDDEAAEAVAQNGMMLSLHPDYAKQLIDEGLRAASEEPDKQERPGSREASTAICSLAPEDGIAMRSSRLR